MNPKIKFAYQNLNNIYTYTFILSIILGIYFIWPNNTSYGFWKNVLLIVFIILGAYFCSRASFGNKYLAEIELLPKHMLFIYKQGNKVVERKCVPHTNIEEFKADFCAMKDFLRPSNLFLKLYIKLKDESLIFISLKYGGVYHNPNIIYDILKYKKRIPNFVLETSGDSRKVIIDVNTYNITGNRLPLYERENFILYLFFGVIISIPLISLIVLAFLAFYKL